MKDVPILSEGNYVCVLPAEEYVNYGGRGQRAPFWIGRIEIDEAPATGEMALTCCVRKKKIVSFSTARV
eukprot:698064-Pleurochrysis_carterae.AAC.1